MVEVEWRKFVTIAAMARQAADAVEYIIESAIEAHGSALLAVPGGKTPVPVFRALVSRKLDWPKVTLLPTDDRLVAVDHPLSNAGLIRAQFGSTGAKLLTLVGAGDSVDNAGRTAERRLRALRWPLDLVWLGMGEDGHTASILPGPNFDAALNGPSTRLACSVVPDPMPKDAPIARVTLTCAALVATRALMLTITGEKKHAVAEQAIDEGASSTSAIGRVLAAANAPIEIFWCR
jgi:6-phosphogluconolactonase